MAGTNPNEKIYDTVLDKPGDRIHVNKDHRAGHTEVEYSSGHVLHWDKTEVGDGKRLKEVRTLTRIQNPHTWSGQIGYKPGQYERIFGKKEEETNG
jgi:hypothetical protein